MAFVIGDKVRNIYIMNLIGTIAAINSMSYINTIDVQLNDDHMLYECDPDNWEIYFEVGDIVTYKFSGTVYQIYDSSNDGLKLERFNDAGNRYTRFYVFLDDIRIASDAEKSEFYRLKELHETKEKETKDMTSYKVGDIVVHPLFNESIITNISEFENGYVDVVLLTGFYRGQTKTVRIDNIKQADNKLMISIEDYNEMANTIEHLKKEKADLQEKLYAESDKAKCAEVILTINKHFGHKYNNLPEVKEVLYHKPATIIFWKDGTKTVVKTQNKEKYDKEKGFVMAYLKKILGNKGNYYEEIKRWTEV